MKNSEKLLLITSFLSLIPTTSLFALSQETMAIIENIRAKYSSSKQPQQVITSEYIPGKELSVALEKLRQATRTSAPAKAEKKSQNLCSNKCESSIPSETEITFTQTPQENKAEPTEKYVAGQLLKKSLEDYRQSAKARDLIRIKNKPEKIQSENSHELIKKANQEIEELFNNSEKRAQVAERARKEKSIYKSKEKANRNPNDNPVDDRKFNNYIKQYNFKMPKNYRIVIE